MYATIDSGSGDVVQLKQTQIEAAWHSPLKDLPIDIDHEVIIVKLDCLIVGDQ